MYMMTTKNTKRCLSPDFGHIFTLMSSMSWFSKILFLKSPTPACFCYLYLPFLSTLQKNSVTSGIQIRIIGEEGKDTDHYTTTMALL